VILVSGTKNTSNLFGNTMDATYAEVGTEVVVCFHRPERYPQYIQRYVCKKTFITMASPTTYSDGTADGGVVCKVQIDNGYYWWSIQDMILASDIDLLTPEQRSRIR